MEKSYQNMSENRTAKYLKYLCEHGKYKYQCKECGGTQICPHNRQKCPLNAKSAEGLKYAPITGENLAARSAVIRLK